MLSQHTTIEPDKKYKNKNLPQTAKHSDASRNARHTAKERYGTRKVSGEQYRTWPETIHIPANRRSCRGENFLWHAGEAASLQFHSAAMSPSPFPCSAPPLSSSLAALPARVLVTTHKQRTKNLRTRTRLQSATQKSKENGYEMEETVASHPSTNGWNRGFVHHQEVRLCSLDSEILDEALVPDFVIHKSTHVLHVVINHCSNFGLLFYCSTAGTLSSLAKPLGGGYVYLGSWLLVESLARVFYFG